MRALLLLAALLAGCGFTHVAKQCPTCPVIEAAKPRPVAVKPTARTLYVLVPGVLGFGWEWDGPVERLRTRADLDFVVFWWTPYTSLMKAGGEMHRVLVRLLTLPSVDRLVVVGHSVGGLVAVEGLRDLEVPSDKQLEIVTVGTPFGGMNLSPSYIRNPRGTPLILATAGQWDSHASAPAGASVTLYVTSWPPDPVVKPHFGRSPIDPRFDPPGARRIEWHAKDHNRVLDEVFDELLRHEGSAPPAPR